jgi:hypothetical protein
VTKPLTSARNLTPSSFARASPVAVTLGAAAEVHIVHGHPVEPVAAVGSAVAAAAATATAAMPTAHDLVRRRTRYLGCLAPRCTSRASRGRVMRPLTGRVRRGVSPNFRLVARFVVIAAARTLRELRERPETRRILVARATRIGARKATSARTAALITQIDSTDVCKGISWDITSRASHRLHRLDVAGWPVTKAKVTESKHIVTLCNQSNWQRGEFAGGSA